MVSPLSLFDAIAWHWQFTVLTLGLTERKKTLFFQFFLSFSTLTLYFHSNWAVIYPLQVIVFLQRLEEKKNLYFWKQLDAFSKPITAPLKRIVKLCAFSSNLHSLQWVNCSRWPLHDLRVLVVAVIVPLQPDSTTHLVVTFKRPTVSSNWKNCWQE